MSMNYHEWLEVATGYVVALVVNRGGIIRNITDWHTGSRYIKIQLPPRIRLQIRLSDHKCKARGPKVFFVTHPRTWRLLRLTDWLTHWARPEPTPAAPTHGHRVFQPSPEHWGRLGCASSFLAQPAVQQRQNHCGVDQAGIR